MKTAPITLDPQNLPDDLHLLKALVADLITELKNKEANLDKVRHQLHMALNRHYGRKSESFSPDQMALFQKLIEDQIADIPKVDRPEAELKVPVKAHGRRKPPTNLPKKTTPYPLPEDKKTCPDCKIPLKKIGEETRSLINWVPASIFVQEDVAEKYACPKCQNGVVKSELPPQPIHRGMAGAGLLAQVVTSKYAHHLPLYRQQEIFATHGFEVNPSTLGDWCAQVADLFDPIYSLMKSEVLKSKVIHCDETPVPVLEERPGPKPPGFDPAADADAQPGDMTGRRKARLGRLWIYAGDDAHPHNVFDYTPNRSGDGPKNFLGPWKGFLQADAYAGYDARYVTGDIVEVGCMAHVRRYFKDALPTDKSRCQAALAFISDLYLVETAAKGVDAAKRRELRQAHSLPLMEKFKTWLDAQALIVLPKSVVGEAIGYALRQWDALRRYLEDGDLHIDNNTAENALRGLCVGRRNWLFLGSDAGGHRAAVLVSLVESCKRHHVAPFAYLNDVINRLATHPRNKIRELLPDAWATAHAAKVAALAHPQTAV